MNSLKLNKQALKNGEILPVLSLAFFIAPEKIKYSFSKVGVTVDSVSDVNALADIVLKKLDVSGSLKNKDGNPVIFDTVSILKNISFSQKEFDRTRQIIFE